MAKKKYKGEEKTSEQKFRTFWLVWNLVEDILLIAAGVLAIVFGVLNAENAGDHDVKTIQDIILYVLASFIVLDGLLRTIVLAKNHKGGESSAYLIGGFEITIGIVLMILGSAIFFQLIINFLGVFLLVIGAMFLFVSILNIVKRLNSLFMPVLEILFGAILIGFGIALMIIWYAGEDSVKNIATYVLIGTILALTGIALLIGLLAKKAKQKREDKKLAKQEVFDVRKEEPVETAPVEVKKPDVVDEPVEAEVVDVQAIEEKSPDSDKNEVIEIE